MYFAFDQFPGTTLLDRDPEVAEGFDGRLPGTLGIPGYDGLYYEQQRPPSQRLKLVRTTLNPPPNVSSQRAMARLKDLQDFGPQIVGVTTFANLRSLFESER